VASLVTALDDPRPLVQSAASFGLGEMGAAATGALPKLVAVLGGPDDSAAAMATWAIGEVAGERPGRRIVLLQMLRFGPVPDRGDAVASVAAMGPSGLSYAPMLVRMLAHPDPSLGRAAANALIRIGPLVRPAVEAVAFRGDARVQREARRILSALDPPL
jgi:HEAT repeat protein